MMLRYVALGALAGCQLVFSPLGPDAAAGDAPDRDVLEPASGCPPVPVSCEGNDPDEDEDGPRDDCDECPQFDRVGGVADEDSDGVGDACDPEPKRAQTCRSRWFFGFAQSSVDRVETRDVPWRFDGSAAPEDPDAASTILRVLSREDHATGRLETVIEDGSLVAGAPDQLAGVVALSAGPGGYACGIRQRSGGIGTLALYDPDQGVLAESEPFAVTPGLTHRVQLTVRVTGKLACLSFRADGQLESLPLEVQVALPEPAVGRIGLVLVGMSASFRYLDFVPD
jgi:hypothetical protein